MHERPPICADVMGTVGRAVQGSGSLNLLLRECGLTKHKAIFVKLLTDVLNRAAAAGGPPVRYSELRKQQQITVLAAVWNARPVYFRSMMTVWSNVGLAQCQMVEQI